MKTNNKIFRIVLFQLVLLCFVCSGAFAQDASLTQAYANPILLNPAILGANGDLQVIANYKNQLADIQKGYTSSSLGILYPLYVNDNHRKFDLGLNLQNDVAGAFRNFNASLSVGYDLQLSVAAHLSVALLGEFGQRSLTIGDLSFDEQYINGSYSSTNAITENLLNITRLHQDFGFGAMWYYNPVKTETDGKINCFVGVAGYHLNTPNVSVISSKDDLTKRFSIQAGIKIIGDHKIDVAPNVRINLQGGMQEVTPGLYLDYRFKENSKLTLATWFRLNGTMAFLLGLEYKNLTFGYSYDVYAGSEMGRYWSSASANQISLIYKYRVSEKKGLILDASPFSSF